MDATPPRWPAGRPLRLATRGSPLARIQAATVAEALTRATPGLEIETVVVRTTGDRLATEPLERIGGQGAFVVEVQVAVLEGRADAAVHSAKDLPSVAPEGLRIAAVPERADVRDALVGGCLSELAPAAVVATGSARRRAQLANLRPDLVFRPLRGNMERRVRTGADPEIGAVVVAMAAMQRLGWADQVAEALPTSVLLPQVGQGALALECRADDAATAAVLGTIDATAAHQALVAERAFLAAVGGSCSLPVGALARPVPGHPGRFRLQAMMASADGRVVLHAAAEGAEPVALGEEVARQLHQDCGASSLDGWDRS